ncbi:MAG: DUF1653 domain-containing protein [Eubacteriales bacterium]
MRQEPRAYEVYEHFKGKLYQIITIAKDSETLEDQVVYRQLYAPYEAYVRPLKMFLEKVDQEKYPNVEQEYRFELRHMNDSKEACVQELPCDILGDLDSSEEDIEPIEHLEEDGLHPLFLQFFDEDTFLDKIKVLEQMKSIVTHQMLTSMAVATDITISETGEIEERYAELRSCLYTLEKFECNR